MIALSKKFKLNSATDTIEVDIYGDTHYGSDSVDEDMIKKHINETSAKDRYWVHLGDVIDGILPSDKRFKASNLAPWAWNALQDDILIEAEWARFETDFGGIQDRCLFVLDGDGKHNRINGISNCMDNTLNRMRILDSMNNNGTTALMYKMNFTVPYSNARRRLDIAAHHGWFSGRMTGGKINNLERALDYYPECKVFMCGHGHTKILTPPHVGLILSSNRSVDKVKHVIRRGVMTGSYYKTYNDSSVGYSEIHGYPPKCLGRITMVIKPFCHDPEELVTWKNI